MRGHPQRHVLGGGHRRGHRVPVVQAPLLPLGGPVSGQHAARAPRRSRQAAARRRRFPPAPTPPPQPGPGCRWPHRRVDRTYDSNSTRRPRHESAQLNPNLWMKRAIGDKLLRVSQKVAGSARHPVRVDRRDGEGRCVTEPRRDNLLIVHWHDLGRYLGVYGHDDVSSPRLDQLAAEGILLTHAHATAPLCSPSRGSLFTGRYPQSNGLLGLAHHGWEYRTGIRTLPHILSESGWYTALFGMQHETSLSSTARLRRVRRIELVLRVCRRTGRPVAHRPACATVSSHRRVLRNAPALSARSLRTRQTPPASAYPTTCPIPQTSGRISPSSTGRSRWPTQLSAACWTRLPRPAWTAPPGWCS